MTALNYASLLGSINIQAALRVIRLESNQTDDGPHSAYRAMYHPDRRKWWEGPLNGPHPRAYERTPTGQLSSAFGAYQIVWATLEELLGIYEGLENDIRPYMQDCWCVALLHRIGALEDIIDGRLHEWIDKARHRWAILPNSSLSDGGTKVAMQQVEAIWQRHGGATVTYTISKPREPAPVEDRSTPARPEDIDRINETEPPMASPFLFILPLLQSLFEAFTPVLRAKATKALDKQGVDQATSGAVADALMAIVKQVAGQATTAAGVEPRAAVAAASDPLVAVATVKSSPAMLAQVEAQMSDYLDKIAPMIDRIEAMEQGAWKASEDSMDRAAVRAVPAADDWMAKALVGGILIVSGLLIALVAGVAITQIALLTSRTPTTEVWAALTGIIGTILGILGTVFAFRFGTSRQSSGKDVVIAELSARRNP